MKEAILEIYTFSSIIMVGVIWVIQVSHYPGFCFVDKKRFSDFHLFHSKSISYVVMPVMLAELFSCIYLVWYLSSKFSVHLVFILLLWLLTFFVSVPIHRQLASEYDEGVVKRLVFTNWPRTFLWSLKAVLLFLF